MTLFGKKTKFSLIHQLHFPVKLKLTVLWRPQNFDLALESSQKLSDISFDELGNDKDLS